MCLPERMLKDAPLYNECLTERKESVKRMKVVSYPLVTLSYVATLCSVLAGCTTIEARYPMNEGWRVGWVSVIQTAKETPDDLRSNRCVAALSDDTHVATVAYPHLRGMRYQAFQIPTKLAVRTGDKVVINIDDCSKPMASLTS